MKDIRETALNLLDVLGRYLMEIFPALEQLAKCTEGWSWPK